MTAVVSRERAKATWLVGVVGLVILAVAFVMMAYAAPSLAHPRPHKAPAPSASVSTSSLITGSWSARWTGRAGQGRRAG
jgi:divalent metal cation (Fe/Co/Zn/Cd) transporter